MRKEKAVLIIDKYPLFREGIKSLVASEPLFRTVGEAGTAADAIQKVSELKTDLIFIDISLPDRNGIELLRNIRRITDHPAILIVSRFVKRNYILESLRNGANGYLLKNSGPGDFVNGMHSVIKGEYYLDSSIMIPLKEILKDCQDASPANLHRQLDGACSLLTSREEEIMQFLAEGYRPSEIGQTLFISTKTVENHKYRIMQKLNCRNYFELVRYAAKLGLIDVDLWKE